MFQDSQQHYINQASALKCFKCITVALLTDVISYTNLFQKITFCRIQLQCIMKE